MKKIVLLLAYLLLVKITLSQNFLNGDFENTTALSCQVNLSNATFNAAMFNSTAFGSANQIDIQNNSCGYGTPYSGNWFISLTTNVIGIPDALSLSLSVSLIPGTSYHFCYYEKANTQFTGLDSLQIGLSTTPTNFGTLIYTSQPISSVWTKRIVTFTAPNNGSYITIRNKGGNRGWNFIDNFSFNCCLPFSLGSDINLCNGNSVLLNATTSNATYLWQDNSSSSTYTATTAGNYWVTITTSACSVSDTIKINSKPSSASIQNPIICLGDSYTLPKGTIVFTAGTYYDTLTSYNGCDSIVTTILTTNITPIANTSANVSILYGQSVTLTAIGGGNYNWFPSVGLNTTTNDSVITSSTETITYCVEVAISNGCKDTACLIVTVDSPCPKSDKLKIPNAFSPNADGVNDEFCLNGWEECIEKFVFTIYDRWGEKVFESTQTNFCWDGKNNGKVINPQVLVYYVRAKYHTVDKTIIKNGNVSLIK